MKTIRKLKITAVAVAGARTLASAHAHKPWFDKTWRPGEIEALK